MQFVIPLSSFLNFKFTDQKKAHSFKFCNAVVAVVVVVTVVIVVDVDAVVDVVHPTENQSSLFLAKIKIDIEKNYVLDYLQNF